MDEQNDLPNINQLTITDGISTENGLQTPPTSPFLNRRDVLAPPRISIKKTKKVTHLSLEALNKLKKNLFNSNPKCPTDSQES